MLKDFSGLNNPFLTEIEKQMLQKQAKQRQDKLDVFTAELPRVEISDPTLTLSILSDITCSMETTPLNGNRRRKASTTTSTKELSLMNHMDSMGKHSLVNGSQWEIGSAISLDSDKDTGSILDECIYVGDALEHDDFQIRSSRVNGETGQMEYLVEWYDDMDLFKK